MAVLQLCRQNFFQFCLTFFSDRPRLKENLGSDLKAQIGAGAFKNLYGATIDRLSGHIYATDRDLHNVAVYSHNGEFIREFGGPAFFSSPCGITVHPDGEILVVDRGNDRVQAFDLLGNYKRTIGEKGTKSGEFRSPGSVAVDLVGNIVVSDSINHRIQVFTKNGEWIRSIGQETGGPTLDYPVGIAIDPLNGNIIVAENIGSKIRIIEPDGRTSRTFSEHGSKDGQLSFPSGVTVDAQGKIIVADQGNNRVQIFSRQGEFLMKICCPSPNKFHPLTTAIDAEGNLICSDVSNDEIKIFG